MEINDVIMKEKPRIVEPSMTLTEAMSILQSSPGSSLVVAPKDKSDTYGMVTIRDLVFKGIAKGLDPESTEISKVMTKPVLILNNIHLDIKYAAMAMANAGVDNVLIFDGEEMVGKLSTLDILVASWHECRVKGLNELVSDVGGGC